MGSLTKSGWSSACPKHFLHSVYNRLLLRSSRLRHLYARCDIHDPEDCSSADYIIRQQTSNKGQPPDFYCIFSESFTYLSVCIAWLQCKNLMTLDSRQSVEHPTSLEHATLNYFMYKSTHPISMQGGGNWFYYATKHKTGVGYSHHGSVPSNPTGHPLAWTSSRRNSSDRRFPLL